MEDLNLVSMVVISHLFFFVTDLLTNLYPAGIYLLKLTIETLERGIKNVQS